jgi:hypothetical protein
VKERPDNFVGEAFVEVGLFLLGEEDGKIAHRGAAGCGRKQLADLSIMGFAIAGETGAAHPGAPIFRQDRIQGADQSASRGDSRHAAALVLFDGDRQPV